MPKTRNEMAEVQLNAIQSPNPAAHTDTARYSRAEPVTSPFLNVCFHNSPISALVRKDEFVKSVYCKRINEGFCGDLWTGAGVEHSPVSATVNAKATASAIVPP